MRYNKYSSNLGCSVEASIEAIGGKWKGVILYHLKTTKHFNEFQKLMPAITQRMLTKQLHELERDGIVFRKVYAEVPPKVEYSMTDFGNTLQPVLKALEEWGKVQLRNL